MDTSVRDQRHVATYGLTLQWPGSSADRSHPEDTSASLVTRLSGQAVRLVLYIVICSVLDALFTLLHIQQGGSEANPVMALALGQGIIVFVGLKMGLTGLGAVLLAIYEHSWLGRRSLQAMALTYSALLLYHLVLFFR